MSVSVKMEDGQPPEVLPPSERFLEEWKTTKNPVEIKLVYVRYISDINTLDQTFRVAMGFDFVWPASSKDKTNWERAPETFVPEYVPNFEFPNAKEEIKEPRAQANGNSFMITPDGKNFQRVLVYLQCLERFELNNFPFDCQELTVVMDTSFASVQDSLFVPHEGCYSSEGEPKEGNLLSLNRQFCAIPEFRARRVVVEFASRSAEGDEADPDAFRWSQVVIRFQMERRSEGFLWRIAFLCFLLAVCSLAAFTLDPVEERSERLGFLITLVLASVAFQFLVSQYLPPVPYLVLLEKYTVAVFTSTVVLTGLVALIGGDYITSSEDERVTLDTYLSVGFLAWLILSQIVFLWFGAHQRSKERAKFDMGALMLKEKNFDPREDSMVSVAGSGFLPESTSSRNAHKLNPFLSFGGMEKKTK